MGTRKALRQIRGVLIYINVDMFPRPTAARNAGI
jgi:hypothetical protein